MPVNKTKYVIIYIKHNISLMSECDAVAKKIDSFIDEDKKFLILRFEEHIMVTASALSFLASSVNKIKNLQGELVVVTPNQELQNLLQISGLATMLRIFPTLKEFLITYPFSTFNVG
jgi:anti-anti-sigma factor